MCRSSMMTIIEEHAIGFVDTTFHPEIPTPIMMSWLSKTIIGFSVTFIPITDNLVPTWTIWLAFFSRQEVSSWEKNKRFFHLHHLLQNSTVMSQYICLGYTYLKYLAMPYCMIKKFVKVQSAGKKSNRNNLPITSKWQHEQLVKRTCSGYNPFHQLFKTLDILLRISGVSWLTLSHCIFVGRAGVG